MHADPRQKMRVDYSDKKFGASLLLRIDHRMVMPKVMQSSSRFFLCKHLETEVNAIEEYSIEEGSSDTDICLRLTILLPIELLFAD